jgi:hypothetical protein
LDVCISGSMFSLRGQITLPALFILPLMSWRILTYLPVISENAPSLIHPCHHLKPDLFLPHCFCFHKTQPEKAPPSFSAWLCRERHGFANVLDAKQCTHTALHGVQKSLSDFFKVWTGVWIKWGIENSEGVLFPFHLLLCSNCGTFCWTPFLLMLVHLHGGGMV